MYPVSEEYKQEIRKLPLKNRSFMKVTIGLINQEAQRSAVVPDEGQYAYFANLVKPFDNYDVTELYATGEQDYTTAGGRMFFPPRAREKGVFNAGIITKDLLGTIEIRFPLPFRIKGLTIDFGKAFPVDFRIESDHQTEVIRGNLEQEFVTQAIFEETTFLRLIPERMVNGQGRLRIHKLTMGIGIYFDNKLLISADKTEHLSPITESLPAIDFNMAIDNKNRTYDIENRSSSVNFLEPGQEVKIEYGYELDSGTVEWMPGATLFLDSWDADDMQMQFHAADRYAGMEETYYRGQYYPEGISLYELAVDVFADAGTDSRNYWVDGYLKHVMVTNPLPAVTHKEALQIIANAGRCILYQDREGKMYLKSSFIPDMWADSKSGTFFSDPPAVLEETEKTAYSAATENYTTAGGQTYFLPRDQSFLPTGLISKAVADSEGRFERHPDININMEAPFQCFGLQLSFGGNPPGEVKIRTYLEGVLQDTEIFLINALEASIHHEFTEFDGMVLAFTKGSPNNRVVLNHLSFGDMTDYELGYGPDLLKTPKGIQQAKVKELQVGRTLYSLSTEEEKELVKETVNGIGEGNIYTFYWSNPAYGITSNVGRVMESSAYYATVEVMESGPVEIILSGREYVISNAHYIKRLNPTGTVQTWNNVLVSSAEHASDLADWVGEYMEADREYELSYRGDPRIDANDLFYLENKYVDKLMIRAYEHNISFSGGALSGTMKARRVKQNVDKTQNGLEGNGFF